MMFLDGIRVLDLSRVLAGPLAARILGDMGADVLKIEPPSGDDTRAWGPPFLEQGDQQMSAYFMSCNSNKSSLALDFKEDPDLQTLRRLIAVADVVLDNFPPRVARKFQLSARDIARFNPNAVHLNITGYGGDRIDEPGYDVMIQAEAGLMAISGPSHGEASKVGVALVDVLTGMMAANGILAALLHRERHQRGHALNISLFQTALFSLVNVGSAALVTGSPSKRWGNAHPNIVPYQVFQTKDRALMIGAGNDRQFKRLCTLLEIQDPNFINRDNADRVRHREQVISHLQEKIGAWSSTALSDALKQAQIPHAPILRPDEAIAQSRVWNSDTLFAVDHQQLGTLEQISNPLQSEFMRHRHQPPPLFNQGGAETASRWLGKDL